MPRVAHAACDLYCAGEDNDGYAAHPSICPGCSATWIDCEPTDAAISPEAIEIVGNSIDEDCDGSIMEQASFLSGLAGGSMTDFLYQTTQIVPAWPAPQDGVRVSPYYSLSLKGTRTLGWGRTYAQLDLKSWTGGSACELRVTLDGAVLDYPLSNGVNSIPLVGSKPGAVLSQARVSCSAGSMVVDSFLLTNAEPYYSTLQDVWVTWDTMYTPGRQQAPAVARSSPEGDYMLIATQSGFAWSDDLIEWHMANGDRTDTMQYTRDLWWSDLMMMDASNPGPGPYPRVWGINSMPNQYDGEDPFEDGLWYTDDLGATWTMSVDGFWSGIRSSDCPDNKNAYATGALMVQVPGTADILALENGVEAEAPDRGLYYHDGSGLGTDMACEAVTGLPKKLGSALVITQDATGADILVVGFKTVFEPGTDDFASDTLYACTMPSFRSCAVHHGGSGLESGGPFAEDGVCLPIHGATGGAYEDVLEPDVRDMEAEPPTSDAGVVYVSDAGQRYHEEVVAGVLVQSCPWDATERDTTVLRVDLSGVDLQAEIDAEATFVRAAVTDTDPFGSGEPTWANGLFGTLWNSCFHDHDKVGTYDGNLITLKPGEDLGAIASIVLDPSGEFLFASIATGAGDYGRAYSCPTLFRLDAEDPEAQWEPMTSSTADDTDDNTNRAERRASTTMAPDTYEDRPGWEVLPERAVATMAFFGDAAPDLFLGGYQGFYVPWMPATGGFAAGWNANFAAQDRDSMIHDLAWGEDVSGWDVYDAHNVSVCHQCAVSSEETVDQVAVTNGQSAQWLAYATDSMDHREAGDFDCHWGPIAVGGVAQAIWEDPDGINTGRQRAQLWTAFATPSSRYQDQRGILFAEWDDESDPDWDEELEDMSFDEDGSAVLADAAATGWSNAGFGTPCWDGYATPDASTGIRSWGKNFAGTTGVLPTGEREVLECMDGVPDPPDAENDYSTFNEDYFQPWYACSEEVGELAYTWETVGIGYIEALDTIAQDLALAVATSPCAKVDTDGDGVKDTRKCANANNDATGGGLWVIYHPPAGGALQYVHIDADFSVLNPDDDDTIDCVENYTEAAGEAQLGEASSGTPAIQVDRRWFLKDTGTAGLHQLRAFVATSSTVCGVFELRVDLEYDEASDSWSGVPDTAELTALDYDTDADPSAPGSAATRGCKPFSSVGTGGGGATVGTIRGIELDADAEWLMVYGGDAYTYANYTDEWGVMGVCAVRVGEERGTWSWPTTAEGGTDPNPDPACASAAIDCSPTVVPYPAEQAVGRDLAWSTASLVAHPYRSGMFFGGLNTTYCADAQCTGRAQAPYMLQRRTRAAAPGYVWAWKQWPVGDLQMPWGSSMEWGLAHEDGVEVDRIYHGAAIGGMWEGRLWY